MRINRFLNLADNVGSGSTTGAPTHSVVMVYSDCLGLAAISDRTGRVLLTDGRTAAIVAMLLGIGIARLFTVVSVALLAGYRSGFDAFR